MGLPKYHCQFLLEFMDERHASKACLKGFYTEGHQVIECWWKEQHCQQQYSYQFHIWCYFNSPMITRAMLLLILSLLFPFSLLVNSNRYEVSLLLWVSLHIISRWSFLTLSPQSHSRIKDTHFCGVFFPVL